MNLFHPGLQRLRRFADAELGPRARRATARHLERCCRCRDTLGWIRSTRAAAREIGSDARSPAVVWERVRGRLESGETLLLPLSDPTPPPVSGRGRLAAAALLLVLVFAGGVAALVPGSPVRAWFTDVLAADMATAVESSPAGLLLPDDSGPLEIQVLDPHPDLRLHVRVVAEDARLESHLGGGSGTARFTAGPGRIVITGAGPGEVLLALPEDHPDITVSVDGRRYLELRGGEIRLFAPAADTAGAELIVPVRPQDGR